MSKEAMKLALEALNTTESDCGSRAWEREQEAITALLEALAEQPAQTDWEAVAADQALTIALLKAEQPAQQEPEYWLWACGQHIQVSLKKPEFPEAIPLYTSPPAQRKPLTDEEIEKCFAESDGTFVSAGRAIEAAHGIKGDA